MYRPRSLARSSGSIGDLPKASEPVFRVTDIDAQPVEAVVEHTALDQYSHQEPFPARITEYELLSSAAALKRVYRVRLDVSRLTQWSWMPGDAFGILPENEPSMVQWAVDRLGLDPDQVVQLDVIGKVARDSLAAFWQTFHKPVTVGGLFAKHVDLTYFPKKACLAHLAQACSDPGERDDLLFLASKTGSAEYLRLAGGRNTILDFLATFPSCRPTLTDLLTHLPLLHPRFYSICNSPLDGSGCCEFIFNTIEYATPEGLPRWGTASSWIERTLIGRTPPSLSLVPRPNSAAFRLDPTRPAIMICAGTGISPFIGFLRHLALSDQRVDSWLFFGFRNLEQDYLFQSELQAYLRDGLLSRLTLAVSRQDGYPKYVQHAMEQERELLEWLPNAKVYICGDELTMVKEVNETIVRLAAQLHNVPHQEAAAICKQWAAEGKIVRDIWI